MKKIVHYDDTSGISIQVGGSAFVYTIDHTSDLVSNEKLVQTSKVLSYDKATGEFETLNSLYKPVTVMLKELN